MMKNALLLILGLFLSASVFAQSYKPMNGYYDFKGNVRFSDTLFLDSTNLDPAQGLSLIVDTTGSSTSGYYKLDLGATTPQISTYNNSTLLNNQLGKLNFIGNGVTATNTGDSIVVNIPNTGTVTGNGLATQIPIWSSATELIGSSELTFSSSVPSITLGGVTGGSDTAIFNLDDVAIKTTANDLELKSPATKGVIIEAQGSPVINVDSNRVEIVQQSAAVGTEFKVANKDASSALFVEGTGYGSGSIKGAVSINTETPAAYLHITADSDQPFLRVDDPVLQSSGASTGTLGSSFPTAAAPAAFIIISINGTNYFMPVWTTP